MTVVGIKRGDVCGKHLAIPVIVPVRTWLSWWRSEHTGPASVKGGGSGTLPREAGFPGLLCGVSWVCCIHQQTRAGCWQLGLLPLAGDGAGSASKCWRCRFCLVYHEEQRLKCILGWALEISDRILCPHWSCLSCLLHHYRMCWKMMALLLWWWVVHRELGVLSRKDLSQWHLDPQWPIETSCPTIQGTYVFSIFLVATL